jgi:hypothetical protein
MTSFARPATVLGLICLSAALAFVAACRDDGGEPAVQEARPTIPPPTPTATPTSAPISPEQRAQLDAVVEALDTQDAEAVRRHVGYREVACSPEGPAFSGSPECAPGEDAGTLAPVFYLGVCEGQYLRPEDIDLALDLMVGLSLHAVYRLPPAKRSSGDFSIILVDTAELRLGQAWEAIVDDGEIVALLFSCALSAEDLLERRGYEDLVID